MRIYLAARVSKRHVLQAWTEVLEAAGHQVVSRWSRRGSNHVGPSDQASDADRERYAREDIEDIETSDCVISLMEEPRTGGRGGRHVEFGIALATGKRMVIVGPRETVFHHLPVVEHFETEHEMLEAICRNRK